MFICTTPSVTSTLSLHDALPICLEKLVSERTRELERGREQYRLVVEGTQAIPFALDVEDGHFEYIGPQGPQRLGFSEDLWKQIGFLDRLMPRERNSQVRSRIDESSTGSFEIG